MGKSSSLEDYLKCILVLQKKNDSVRSIDIAEEMGVTKPSVCNAMKKLRKQKWIYFDEEGYIFFTDEGRLIAENIYSKHSLLSRLLELMGVSKDTAEKEACLMEHTISDETYERMDEFVNTHEENGNMFWRNQMNNKTFRGLSFMGSRCLQCRIISGKKSTKGYIIT